MDPAHQTATARVSLLTAEGRGAVSVVRVWGPGALKVASSVFRPVRSPSLDRSPPGRMRLGRVGSGLGDEVVAVVVDVPHPEVEFHCHGGPAPVAMVLEALTVAGAERRQPSAWIRQTSASVISAEAEVDLARAPTLRSAEVLLDQRHGALGSEIERLVNGLATDPEGVREGVDRLLRDAGLGTRLISGWRVVLAGRPNVGKSRLLNALAGYERAIVDPTPGTTRDVVSVRTAVDGWPIELGDTAGLRNSDDSIEQSGIALSRSQHGTADLLLVVLDRSEPLTPEDHRLMAERGRALVIANKSDLSAAWRPTSEVLEVSAERGDGLELLIRSIARRCIPEPPEAGAAIPFRPRHVRGLEFVSRCLNAGDRVGARDALNGILTGDPGSSVPLEAG